LQPSVSFVNRYVLQPERSLCKIILYKESGYCFVSRDAGGRRSNGKQQAAMTGLCRQTRELKKLLISELPTCTYM